MTYILSACKILIIMKTLIKYELTYNLYKLNKIFYNFLSTLYNISKEYLNRRKEILSSCSRLSLIPHIYLFTSSHTMYILICFDPNSRAALDL